jgi:lipoate-protein ligase A
MQDAAGELDMDALREHGAVWIRRPTGGRAVLHDGDITYSCTFPKSLTVMGGGITETYKIITMCLMDGLGRASIKCAAHDSDNDIKGIRRDVKLPCFLAPNRDEIMVDGRKLAGSAQKRTADAVLQHGSIPITADYRKLPNFLRIDGPEKEKQIRLLASKCCCVHELAPEAAFDSLAECLMAGFSSTLPFKWDLIPWTLQEETDINNMIKTLMEGTPPLRGEPYPTL